MENNHKNIRNYLPDHKAFYDASAYKYLRKELVNEELYLGELLSIITTKHHELDNYFTANVNFKGKTIFTIQTSRGLENITDPDKIGLGQTYTFITNNDKLVKWSTFRFHRFHHDDINYMVENFFCEQYCFSIIMYQLKHYALRRMELLHERDWYITSLGNMVEEKKEVTDNKDIFRLAIYLKEESRKATMIYEKKETARHIEVKTTITEY